MKKQKGRELSAAVCRGDIMESEDEKKKGKKKRKKERTSKKAEKNRAEMKPTKTF